MAGTTLAEAEARLVLYKAAEAAVLGSQRYKIKDRELERASLETIQAGVKYWESQVAVLAARASRRARTRYVVTG